MLSDSVKALLPSRLYFVTDEFQPDEKENPVDSDQETNDLAGAETTGARLEESIFLQLQLHVLEF